MTARKTKKEAESPAVEAEIREEIAEIADESGKSEAYLAFKAHIERYAALNPAKHALKREELLKKLNTL